MVSREDIFEVIEPLLEEWYIILKHEKFRKLGKLYEQSIDKLMKLSLNDLVKEEYYTIFEKSVMFDLFVNYLIARMQSQNKEVIDVLDIKEKIGKTRIRISRPIIYLLEAAIVGSTILSRMINPYSSIFLKATLASIFYDAMLFKIEKALSLLEEGKIDEAKNVLKKILEIDAKNAFNTVTPLPNLIATAFYDKKLIKKNKELIKNLMYTFYYTLKENEEEKYREKMIRMLKSQIKDFKKLEEMLR